MSSLTLFLIMVGAAAVFIAVVRIRRGGLRNISDEELFAEIAPAIQADAARRMGELRERVVAEAYLATPAARVERDLEFLNDGLVHAYNPGNDYARCMMVWTRHSGVTVTRTDEAIDCPQCVELIVGNALDDLERSLGELPR